MGDIRTEPSMEEILASIKRIIADDGLALNGKRAKARDESPPPAPPPPDPVLELTETIAPPAPTPRPEADRIPEPAPVTAAPPSRASSAPRPAAPPEPDPLSARVPPPEAQAASLVSEDAACASRQSLSSLSSMVLRAPGAENTLDGLVRELLRPMLKEWLDARLPDLVESLVAREIARITGKAL